MNRNIAITVDEVSKVYRLGEFSSGALSRDIEIYFKNKFRKILNSDQKTDDSENRFYTALNNVSFELNQGDAVGIVGTNGAGKSTLLKLLSGITSPSSGEIKYFGRLASLLEVGTGFHPELTGRENIYLNGSILGMSKREIALKLDEVIDFSGISGYIDTPVKRYSSGMYVRLAFSVAAHLDSDILIIDEVLAVGDNAFQQKCIEKIDSVNGQTGKTILFVSHNLNLVKKLCNKSLLLSKGNLIKLGYTTDVLNFYSDNLVTLSSASNILSSELFMFKELSINNELVSGQEISIYTSETITFVFFIENANSINGLHKLMLSIFSVDDAVKIFSDEVEIEYNSGLFRYEYKLDANFLAPGRYSCTIGIHEPNISWKILNENFVILNVIDNSTRFANYLYFDYGKILVNNNWIKGYVK
jgi:lipopolysaccharide transport system ATP-binding protein